MDPIDEILKSIALINAQIDGIIKLLKIEHAIPQAPEDNEPSA
jgi:hypothetical protein